MASEGGGAASLSSDGRDGGAGAGASATSAPAPAPAAQVDGAAAKAILEQAQQKALEKKKLAQDKAKAKLAAEGQKKSG